MCQIKSDVASMFAVAGKQCRESDVCNQIAARFPCVGRWHNNGTTGFSERLVENLRFVYYR
jgi:hypothetical protein